MTESKVEGRKYDEGKVPLFRGTFASFPRAMAAIATLGAFGARKYNWFNWQHVPDGIDRYTDAMVRHLNEEAKGNVLDDESGLPHAYSVAWNALARLELLERGAEGAASNSLGSK